ncbi:MAG: SBBP repeat-containing protein [Gemmataceae bacterium]|nr:SBBP repeat-containing protein [Gemmataceae bacterium]
MARFNASGSTVTAFTALGGIHSDYAAGVALEASGNAYVVGRTNSADFPVTTGALQTVLADPAGGTAHDAWVAKVVATGGITWASYMGGAGDDRARGVTIVSGGPVFVTGTAGTGAFPVTSDAYLGDPQGGADAFLAAFSQAGMLGYSTRYGGSGDDEGFAVAVSPAGMALIAGSTSSTDFPLSAPLSGRGSASGAGDAFVAMIAPTARRPPSPPSSEAARRTRPTASPPTPPATPRRGSRAWNLERLPLKDLLLWLQHQAEEELGRRDEVSAGRPMPRGPAG